MHLIESEDNYLFLPFCLGQCGQRDGIFLLLYLLQLLGQSLFEHCICALGLFTTFSLLLLGFVCPCIRDLLLQSICQESIHLRLFFRLIYIPFWLISRSIFEGIGEQSIRVRLLFFALFFGLIIYSLCKLT